MLVTSIQFGLFCIYPSLIFRMSVIYACFSYSIWLILHLSFPYFQLVSHLCLLLLSNLAYFAFILALFLGCQSSMLVTPINLGFFSFYLSLFLIGQSSFLFTSNQFGLFFILPCLIFNWSVIYACCSYPIWLILHLSLPYF